MQWSGTISIATLVSLIIAIIGFVYAMGKLVARFEVIENRVIEDRETNSNQHNEFYGTTRNVEGIKVEITNLVKNVDEMRIDVREILTRLPGDR
jgi:hypothetical protein